jgi:hypothetical protein
MHENTLHPDFEGGFYWWHRWINGEAPVVKEYVDKFRAWRPLQQRPRDGTVVRNRTGGLGKVRKR